jgi:NAD(P)-dependent dehydrogenase (short-subunit alcohol dehydrogenase family)
VASSNAGAETRVVVVTGGAAGIGAAIAEELGRSGAFVVTVDPGLTLDGSTRLEETAEPTTADRIVAAGGQARASNTSVTDAAAVSALFHGLVEEFGSLDAVVNVAGISRPTGFALGKEDDWTAVLDVHLNGYLNVLRAALPIMAAAGHGRIVGVTSGSGWRPADAGAYSCAKRAVASLTWQVGAAAPPGVSVNALSPIAATRMVLGALARQAAEGNQTGRSSASGGVSLGLDAVPPPEHLGPVGAYLASEQFGWCSGQIVFSNGAELAWVRPPHLLEVARTAHAASLSAVVDRVVPVAFATAEAAQATNGGGNPRLRGAFDEHGPDGHRPPSAVRRCLLVSDVAAVRDAVENALAERAVECVDAGAPVEGFEVVAGRLEGILQESGPIDAVVIAFAGTGAPGGSGDWQEILDAHAGITDDIHRDSTWIRVLADHANDTGRPLRVVTITDATSAGGRSRAQASAQLSRPAHAATENRVDAFAIALESSDVTARTAAAELTAHLLCTPDAASLSGAELVADTAWIGLRTHPTAAGTVTYGGPDIPDWLDGALRSVVTG